MAEEQKKKKATKKKEEKTTKAPLEVRKTSGQPIDMRAYPKPIKKKEKEK